MRDNSYVHTTDGDGERTELEFGEQSLREREPYYYVRGDQKDGNVAWSSPIWIAKREPDLGRHGGRVGGTARAPSRTRPAFAVGWCKIETEFYFARMIPRKITKILRDRLAAYPAVALVGPRQCGKTTIARSLQGLYYDIEQQSDQLRVDIEWPDLIGSRELVIFDEAQAWPNLFARLRGAIDVDRRRNGRFLLLGSVSPALMTRVSESLAGRISIVELTPMTASELETPCQRSRHWLCGGYADGGVLSGKGFPRWQRDYLDLLVQRDLPTWGLPARHQTTSRLLRMIAATHGQEWNASRIGRSMALSYHTVNKYLDYLDGAFLVRRLPPYHANIRKRLVKRTKVYVRDTGLLHALLNVTDDDALFNHPAVGASWEGYVVEQVLAALQHADRLSDAYFLRTRDQREIDLVIQLGSELWAVDTKLTTQPTRSDVGRLGENADLIGATKRFLVCRSACSIKSESQVICDLSGFERYLAGGLD